MIQTDEDDLHALSCPPVRTGCAGVAPIFSNPTLRNFEPRFGFAWDPSGSGKTAVRGGFAIFDVLPLPGYFFSQAWAPFFLTTTLANKAALAETFADRVAAESELRAAS